MKKQNVLQVNKLYYPFTGGVERVVQELAEGLKDRVNMRVLVCSEDRTDKTETIGGVKVHRSGSFFMLGNLPLSVKFIRDFRRVSKNYDIIQFHMPFPIGDLAELLSGYQGKVVVWWHSDVVRQKKMMLLYKPIMERFLKRADVIITATQGHIDGSAYLKPYAGKCRVIPYGVDPELEKRADAWLAQRPLKAFPQNEKRPVRFLFVGRLIYYKGCKVLLEAFRRVKNAELTLVGDGVMTDELKAMAESFHLTDRVHFLGAAEKEELYRQFEDCDVFVLPSIARSEAFGLVQIEAMSYAKPVINTNLKSGVPYVSVHGKTGLTVEPENVQELADAMNWMVKHPKEREEMGARAKQRVKEEYQTAGMLEKTLGVYRELGR